MRIHHFAAVAALAIVLPGVGAGCNWPTCAAGHEHDIGCVAPPGATGAGCSEGQHQYACNLDSSLPGVVQFPNPPPCGVVLCASDDADAANKAGALANVSASDPRLNCVSLGFAVMTVLVTESIMAKAFNVPGGVCISRGTCDPCDDGQGGTLQSVGEHCGGEWVAGQPVGFPAWCCAGLTCVGATASEMGMCQGTPQCAQAQPNWQPLPTTMLRQIAVQNKVDGCDTQTGITQSRTIGLAFEKWVLTTLGVVPSPPGPDKNTTLFMSMGRQKKTGGLPASVIPEFVGDQTYTVAGTSATFSKSVLYEVKAVTGALTLGTSSWQILGLLDVANNVQPVPAGLHPAVFFITTGNTTVSTGVLTQATMPMWNVAVWQQQVLYDANGGSNPNLTLGPPTCLTLNLCGPPAAVPSIPNPGPPVSQLTSPTTPPSALLVPGDPDPPEVD